MKYIAGNIVDVCGTRIFPGRVEIRHGKISRILPIDNPPPRFILPGFIDAHIHLESLLMPPAEAARLAVANGTIAMIADPHAIANLNGLDGIEYMLNNSRMAPFHFFFGAPPCVNGNTAGEEISAEIIDDLLSRNQVNHLAEVLNYSALFAHDAKLLKKLKIARSYGVPIDGHTPGLTQAELKICFNAGISTDHESITMSDAIQKLQAGFKLVLRHNSCTSNFDSLCDLLDKYPKSCMFCSDTLRPDGLVAGHINTMVKMALKRRISLFSVLRCACVNPARHYRLNTGLLREGDCADFIAIDNFDDFNIIMTVINGCVVARNNKPVLPHFSAAALPGNFIRRQFNASAFSLPAQAGRIKVIELISNQIITRRELHPPKISRGKVISDAARDILKIVLIPNTINTAPIIGFVKNFGLRRGAIASSNMHDSSNIVAIGANDSAIAQAINTVIDRNGGMCVIDGNKVDFLPLPIAGLMTDMDGFELAKRYTAMKANVREMGATVPDPFLSLAFLDLNSLPELKMNEQGLYNVDRMSYTHIFEKV